MRLHEIATKGGTFVAVRIHNKNEQAILRFIKEQNIPNAIPQDDIHITLVYSKKHLPTYQTVGAISEIATPKKFTKFTSNPGDGTDKKQCLVLLVNSDFLHDRQAELVSDYGATSDFDSYSPHITFSYDVGDFDVTQLGDFDGDIDLVEEYHERLSNP